MPNIKSAKKQVRVQANRAARNRTVKTALKTVIKKADIAAAEGDLSNAGATFKKAQESLDKAVSYGILHKNTAARRKSRLARQLNALSGGGAS